MMQKGLSSFCLLNVLPGQTAAAEAGFTDNWYQTICTCTSQGKPLGIPLHASHLTCMMLEGKYLMACQDDTRSFVVEAGKL